MATLASTPRTTTLTLLASSAGPFEVGFRIFSVAAIKVFVNGVEVETGWSVTATFSGGYTDSATITFDDALEEDDVLQIDDWTPVDRGVDYLAADPSMAAKLNIELPRLAAAIMGLQRDALRSLRLVAGVPTPLAEMSDGVLILEDGALAVGPTVDEVSGAAQSASDAQAAQAAAEAAQAAAEAAIVSLLSFWQGNWATTTAYTLGDFVKQSGNVYMCAVAHTSGLFATDFGNGYWIVFVTKGDSGPGSGDLLEANALSELTDQADDALENLGFDPYFHGLRSAEDIADLLFLSGLDDEFDGKQDASARLDELLALLGAGSIGKSVGFAADGLTFAAVARPFSLSYTSADTATPAAGGSQSFTHGLGAVPKLVTVYYVCATANNGYSVDDVVDAHYWVGGTNSDVECNATWRANATTINVTTGNNGVALLRQSDGQRIYMNQAHWNLRVCAYL